HQLCIRKHQRWAHGVGCSRGRSEPRTGDGSPAAKSSLTVLISVGGWLWSTNFSDVSLTPQSRSVFIGSVMDFLKLYDLDGLDVDWEYPGLVGSGHPFRNEDGRNF